MATTRSLASAAILLTVACASLTGCKGTSTGTPVSTSAAGHRPTPTPTLTSPAPGTTAPRAGGAVGPASCRGSDLRVTWGYGTQSTPQHAAGLLFTDVSGRTCTLRGHPGVAIVVGDTAVDATRALNGFRGNLPPPTSPPLVTLRPGGTAYAVVQWALRVNRPCYPTGTGSLEVTSPNTTTTVTPSRGPTRVGTRGICSGLTVNPVLGGTFGATANG